jgi:oligopeptide transport system ATP-binding protein
MPETLLNTVNLCKSFPVRRGFFGNQHLRLRAVDRVNLTIAKGETLGLVGESGCGKTTLGLTIMRLYEPTSGSILFEGEDFAKVSGDDLSKARRKMQMIFQDPFASLDPRMTVEEILKEPLTIHNIGNNEERNAEVDRLLKVTGLPSDAAIRYPSEFSGGQQQRIGIARALALQPRLLICDEPVSALDVSVQAQILNLLRDLQDQFELTYLFISHNMAVTAFMSRRIGVMYLGQLAEIGPSKEVVRTPRHPYTMELLKAVPSPIDRPSGCPFHPRCPLAQARCNEEEPELRELAPDHFAACFFA